MAAGQSDYIKLLGATWETVIKRQNRIVVLVGAAAVTIVGLLTAGILAGPLALGFATTCLKMVRGELVRIDDLWSGFDRLVSAIVTMLIVSVGTIIGIGCLVIPGLVVMILSSFTFHVMAEDPNISGLDAVRRSADIVKANLTDVLVVWIVLGLINAVFITTVVGAVPGIAFASVMLTFLYEEIKVERAVDVTDASL